MPGNTASSSEKRSAIAIKPAGEMQDVVSNLRGTIAFQDLVIREAKL